MFMRNANRQKQQGFTLIEAMITVAVLSFGLLAIGSFQAKLVSESAYNKARAEALTLAQTKLDDIRSYSTEHGMVEKLLDNPVPLPAQGAEYQYPADVPAAATDYSDNPSGINADFTRTWTVRRAVTTDPADQDSLLSNVVVVVSWTDRQGTHNVSLESELTWRNPRGTADLEEITTPLVEAPTGKAYLGDGTLDKAAMDKLKSDHPETNNNDGTYTYDHDNDGDLELVVEQSDGSGEVVLTLPDACKVETGCTDFVKISGSVFFHRKTGTMKYSQLSANAVWVLASDAAYCSRWKPTGVSGSSLTTSTDLTTLPPSGGDIYRNNDAVVDFTGAGSNNYDYFNYTCYLGGGWYGNIGLVLLKSTNQDYACVGDPSASDADPDDKWRRVEVAKRRVYRGMLHQYTVDGNGDHVEVTNASGDTIFYSQGIHDAARYPDPSWADRNQGHDFVISNTNSPTIADCKTVMGVPDADPDGSSATANLFNRVSGDFICLNEDGDNSHPGAWAKFLGYPWNYLNTFDTQIKDARLSCPYDPSVPPSKRYTIRGLLAMDSLTDSTWGSGSVKPELKLFDGNINTSDGIDNCRILSTSSGGTDIEYECDYYVWSDIKNNEFPWSGAVNVNTPNDVVCAPENPYSEANLGSAVKYDLLNKTGNLTGINFTCKDKKRFEVQGTITTDAGNDLKGTGPQITVYDAAGAEIAGACSIDESSSSATSVVYSCKDLLEPTYLAGFTGKVELAVPADYSCTSQTSIDGVAGCSASVVSWSFTDLKSPTMSSGNSVSTGNNATLKGPVTVYQRSGRVLNGGFPLNPFVSSMFVDPASTDLFAVNETPWAGSCLWDPATITTKAAGYNCTFTVDSRLSPSWSGQVNVIPRSGWTCGSFDATVPPTGSLPDVTCDVVAPLPELSISGDVVVAFSSDTAYEKYAALPSDGFDSPTPPFFIDLWDQAGQPVGNCNPTPVYPAVGEPNDTPHSFTCTVPVDPVTGTWEGSVHVRLDVDTPWATVCAPDIIIQPSPAGTYDPNKVGGDPVVTLITAPEYCGGTPPPPPADALIIDGYVRVDFPSDTAYEADIMMCPTCGNDIVTPPIDVALLDQYGNPTGSCSPAPIVPDLANATYLNHTFSCSVPVDPVTGTWGGSVQFGIAATYWAKLCTPVGGLIKIPDSPKGIYDPSAVGGDPVAATIEAEMFCP